MQTSSVSCLRLSGPVIAQEEENEDTTTDNSETGGTEHSPSHDLSIIIALRDSTNKVPTVDPAFDKMISDVKSFEKIGRRCDL